MSETKSKAGQDARGNDLYLRVSEEKRDGYFHIRARFCTQKYDQGAGGWEPYGVEDDYSDGLLWSGLQASCQGDDKTRLQTGEGERGGVYGFGCEYRDVYAVDLRKVRRMAKTLERLDKGMDRLTAARGYVRSYGEYLGRLAEVFSCKGFAFERTERSQHVTGQRYRFESVGDGVNKVNHLIYLWQREVLDPRAAQERLQLGAGEVTT